MVSHRLGPYEVIVATDYGPRVIELRRADGPAVPARGHRIRLEPGDEARHRESWEVVTCSTPDTAVRIVTAPENS